MVYEWVCLVLDCSMLFSDAYFFLLPNDTAIKCDSQEKLQQSAFVGKYV